MAKRSEIGGGEGGVRKGRAAAPRYGLAFFMMIDADLTSAALERELRQSFAAARRSPNAALDPAGNHIELCGNAEYAPERIEDPEEGWRFFPYRLEITPTSPRLSVEHQVAFAKALLAELGRLGHPAVICAEFEELL